MKNVKITLAFLLVVLLVLPMLAACKNEEPASVGTETSNEVKLWYSYNTENLMQDLEYPDLMEERDSTLRMYGVRNDAEPIQLMITPNYDVISYNLKMNDLTSENGDVFSAEDFEMFAVWYIEITESYNNDAYFGFWPDGLVPLENFIIKGHNTIDAGQNQSIWIQANIPADQAPGFYTGSAELDVDGVKYDVPIELKIYDAEVPVENHMPSSYAVWYEELVYGEGYYSDDLAQAYFDFLVDHRTMPLYPADYIANNYEAYVDWIVETQVDDPAIASYGLPHRFTEYELGRIVDRDSVMEMLTLMAEKNIELRQAGDKDIDLFKKAFYYLAAIIDEPSGSGLQRVKDCDLIIQECKQEIADKYFKDVYPDLYRSCITLNHVVTTGYNPELIGSATEGGVQTWCPQFQHYNTEAQRQEYYDRRDNNVRGEYGEELWWYGCNNPKVPFPTFHLDDDLISSRVMFWMQHDYEIEGDLYWAINVIVGARADDEGGTDPWKIPRVVESVQEGRLVYPGARYGVFGPISTMRMESILQGREDFECLWQIEQAIIAYNEANGTQYDPGEVMDYLYDDLYDDDMIPIRDNAEVFMEQRIQMLEVLESIALDPIAGVEAILNG